ncbi:hypothetical protein ACTVCO_05415 [Sanguibacter sp. A247]|uniref:hypothetical protein n=1 Tax=unclassified Sanguibacter TaxID=2645534 RepID=UPI003FD7C079
MNGGAVVVYAPRLNPTRPASLFREQLVDELEMRMRVGHVVTESDFSKAREAITAASLVIVESGAIRMVIDHGIEASGFWILVLPTADRRDPRSRDWVADVLHASEAIEAPRFIVDSEESRDQVEHVLAHRRHEIVVIPRTLDGADPGGRFDYTDWSLGGAHVESSGTWADTWQDLDGERSDHTDNLRATSWKQPAASKALDRLAVPVNPTMVDQSVSVLGANLNFIQQLTEQLSRGHVREVRAQEWTHLSGPPDPVVAQHLLDTSDTVIAEWIRPNAQWIQEHADFDRRLIVRGHRYEITTEFPNRVDMTRYFAAVVITPWVGRKLVQTYGWPADKIVYIPNYIESNYFEREKLEGAQFTLGVVGIRPGLKRIDLALDLLRELRNHDARYNLRVRSALPFDYINWEKDPGARAQWYETLARVKNDPLLRGAVHFDSPGQDMSSWFRQIGVILSLSDLEGSHVAFAEGIASGALGVARRWPGILGMWPEELVHDTLDSAVRAILDVRSDGVLESRSFALRANPVLDANRVLEAWKTLIGGDLDAARHAFGVVDGELGLYDRHDHR